MRCEEHLTSWLMRVSCLHYSSGQLNEKSNEKHIPIVVPLYRCSCSLSVPCWMILFLLPLLLSAPVSFVLSSSLAVISGDQPFHSMYARPWMLPFQRVRTLLLATTGLFACDDDDDEVEPTWCCDVFWTGILSTSWQSEVSRQHLIQSQPCRLGILSETRMRFRLMLSSMSASASAVTKWFFKYLGNY